MPGGAGIVMARPWPVAVALAFALAMPAVAHDRMSRIDAAATKAMSETGAQGLAVAIIADGKVASIRTFGVRNAGREPLTPDTVM